MTTLTFTEDEIVSTKAKYTDDDIAEAIYINRTGMLPEGLRYMQPSKVYPNRWLLLVEQEPRVRQVFYQTKLYQLPLPWLQYFFYWEPKGKTVTLSRITATRHPLASLDEKLGIPPLPNIYAEASKIALLCIGRGNSATASVPLRGSRYDLNEAVQQAIELAYLTGFNADLDWYVNFSPWKCFETPDGDRHKAFENWELMPLEDYLTLPLSVSTVTANDLLAQMEVEGFGIADARTRLSGAVRPTGDKKFRLDFAF